MTEIVITGCPPYDGHYELDLNQELTTREWGWIKRFAGYLPLAMTDDAFGDPELVCVLAVIALRRAGRIEPTAAAGAYERLSDRPFGTAVTLQAEPDEEGDLDPPASSSSSANISGGGSPASSVTSAPSPSLTGTPGSDSSASGPVTLAS